VIGGKGADLVGNLPNRAGPVEAVFERHLNARFVALAAADHGRAVRDFRNRSQIRFQLLGHGVGPFQVGVGRQLDGNTKARFIGLGHEFRADETGRYEGDGGDEDGQDCEDYLFAVVQGPRQDVHVVRAGPVFEAVHFFPEGPLGLDGQALFEET